MSETKACTITEEEARCLVYYHAERITGYEIDERLDRINYLNKRLKAFKEDGVPVPELVNPQPEPAKTGW